jgi:hypothetical protein
MYKILKEIKISSMEKFDVPEDLSSLSKDLIEIINAMKTPKGKTKELNQKESEMPSNPIIVEQNAFFKGYDKRYRLEIKNPNTDFADLLDNSNSKSR